MSRIDLRSDTVTVPSADMLRAMNAAELGDEQRGDDPTVNRLCERLAEMLGKEAAIFVPTGTMSNLIALLTHCRHGERVLVDTTAHILRTESGGGAAFAGVQFEPVEGTRGRYTPEQVRAFAQDRYARLSPVTLAVVEQTSNRGGGAVWPITELEALGAYTRGAGIRLHMDGARLFNAAIASGVPAKRFAAAADTVFVDFTKGLGCPLGAALVGSAELMQQATVWKRRLGGGLRQAGLLAAGALHALDHHVEALAHDHEKARRLAERLAQMPGLTLPFGVPETNLIFVQVDDGADPAALKAVMAEHGVLAGWDDARTIRLVTHRDLDDAAIDGAIKAFAAFQG